MSAHGHSLVLAFDRDDPEFAYGFEVGRVFEALRSTDSAYECEMHVANAEMVLRLAEATGRVAYSVELGDGWLTVAFGERPS